MECAEVRRILWPADALRVGDDGVETALRHAERCPSCRAFLEGDRRIARLIRESAPRLRVDGALRERLFTALARERAGVAVRAAAKRSPRRFVAAGFLLLLAAVALVFVLRDDRGARIYTRSPAEAFVEDYLRRVVEQEELKSEDRTKVAAFFARELGMPMEPPDVPEFRLRRALVCLMNGRRGGVVEYRLGGRHLAYYVVPHAGEQMRRTTGALDVQQVPGGPAVPATMDAVMGLAVATWRDDRHQHALVGNVPATELRGLAPLFACPAARQ